ncbi:MAG: hypothetical protein NZ739_06780, partial [Verrucomicrobiae bacterium]|nr:hypothetical protein [Verrucomicrobiae bacterium]
VPPTNAYAYVAARYLRQEPTAAQLAAAKPEGELQPTPSPTPEPAPVVETVAPGPEIVATPAEPKVEPAPTTPPPTEPVVISPVPEEQLQPKRIVQREGIVRHSVSIQAPTLYCLVSPETGRIINYLYTTSTNLNLRRYKGLRVIVTGEEGLDPRWTNTPVLTIQRIYVVE